jgi:hypothetical protein
MNRILTGQCRDWAMSDLVRVLDCDLPPSERRFCESVYQFVLRTDVITLKQLQHLIDHIFRKFLTTYHEITDYVDCSMQEVDS